MTPEEQRILQNLVDKGGTGPDRSVLRHPEATDMMRKGWIEAVKPRPPYLPYVLITDAGRDALAGT